MYGVLGMFSQKSELEEQKIEIKELEKQLYQLQEKVQRLPYKTQVEYGFIKKNGFFVNETFFEKIDYFSTDATNEFSVKNKTLITGKTGIGKDWLIKRMLTVGDLKDEKIVYVGPHEDYSSKFGYLKDFGFKQYFQGEGIPRGVKRVFLDVNTFDNKERLRETILKCIGDGCILIWNVGSFQDEIASMIKKNKAIVMLQTIHGLDLEKIEEFNTIYSFGNNCTNDIELFGEIALKDSKKGEYLLCERVQ